MKNPVRMVKNVEAKDDYTLYLTFADGAKKVYNARPLKKTNLFSAQ